MENKRNQCKKCGGEGKPSKALNNTIVYYDDFGKDAGSRGTTGSRQGTAQLVDCIKCKSCGHSWIPAGMDPNDIVSAVMMQTPKEKSTRELALKWWNKMDEWDQLWNVAHSNLFPFRHTNSLTGREIEMVWRKVTKEGSDREIIEHVYPDLKSNQKQFKEFNPELFRAYINKFSNEDKVKAFELIFDSIPDNVKYSFLVKSEIIDWYKLNHY
jgi:hypothetical protein